MQRRAFCCALVIGLVAPSSRATSFPEKGWTTVSQENKDLNGDGKTDAIYWLTQGQGERPERLLIVVDDRAVLDIKDDFCEPGSGYRNPDGCYAFSVTSKLSAKKQPLLVLRSEETGSSVYQSSSTYIYRWQDGDFALIGATYESDEISQVEKRESKQVDINYSTGKALQSSWVTMGYLTPRKDKTSRSCTLKNARKTELLKDFASFNINDQVNCKETHPESETR